MQIFAVIRIITSFFTNPQLFFKHLINKEFGKLIAKYYSQDVLFQFNEYANISTVLNPNAILKILQKSTQLERKRLLDDLRQLNAEDRKQAIKQLDLSKTKTKLSSSWVKYGSFSQYKNSMMGNLTIWVNSDDDPKKRWYGPYTYPLIPVDIWTQMTEAKGKRGSGAGSVMWRTFLREWLPSQFRQFIIKNKETFNKQSLAENQALITKLTTNYARHPNPSGQDVRFRLNLGKSINQRNKEVINQRFKQQYREQQKAIRARITANYKAQRESLINPYKEYQKARKTAYNEFKKAYNQAPSFVRSYVNKQIIPQPKQTKSFGTALKDRALANVKSKAKSLNPKPSINNPFKTNKRNARNIKKRANNVGYMVKHVRRKK